MGLQRISQRICSGGKKTYASYLLSVATVIEVWRLCNWSGISDTNKLYMGSWRFPGIFENDFKDEWFANFQFAGNFPAHNANPCPLISTEILSGFPQLILKNKGRPECCNHNADCQAYYGLLGGLRFFAGSVPPMAQPINEYRWRRRVTFVVGRVIIVIGAMIVWGVAHMVDQGTPIRVGLTLIGITLLFVGLGIWILHSVSRQINPRQTDKIVISN